MLNKNTGSALMTLPVSISIKVYSSVQDQSL